LLVTDPENEEEMSKPVEYEEEETTQEEGRIPARKKGPPAWHKGFIMII